MYLCMQPHICNHDQNINKANSVNAAASFHVFVCATAYLQAMMRCHNDQSQFCDCSRIFPNEEMDQLATALRQVARMLWGIHVTLQMGFEQEASPTSYAYSCIFVHVRAYWYCNPFACSGTCQFLVLSFCTFPCCAQPTTCLANLKHSTGILESYTRRLVSHQACQSADSAQHVFLYRGCTAA